MSLKRWLWILVLISIVVALIAFGYRTQPLALELSVAAMRPLRVTVEEEGKTRILNRYVVSAPVAGYAERVPLKVGDGIEAGEVLVWIQPPPAPVLDSRSRAEQQARVRAAEAAVQAAGEQERAAAAEEFYAASQAVRQRQLLQSGDISRDVADRAASEAARTKAARQSARNLVVQARSELEAARAALEHSVLPGKNSNSAARVPVRAPAGGRVLSVAHESEGPVAPGEALVEIGNARALEVEVEVLSADAVRITPGMQVLFESWGGAQPLEGRVRRVEPVAFTKVSALGVEEQRVKVLVTITSPESEWSRLGDRYRVEATFILWKSDSVLQVPASSLFRRQGAWNVFVVADGRARYRRVEIGRRNGMAAQILAGLKAGETAVAHPGDSVEEGVAVRAR